jgi:hypothetical protein
MLFIRIQLLSTEKVKNLSILLVSDPDTEPHPDPVPNVRIRLKRSGSDRIRIRNTVSSFYTLNGAGQRQGGFFSSKILVDF